MKVLDLGFYFAKVLRGFGLGYEGTLALPIDTFWLLVRTLDRLHAEDDLRALSIARTAAHATKEDVNPLIEALNERIGSPLIREAKLDRDGFNLLKKLSG